MPQPTITTTYAGEFAGKYIAAALLSGNTLSQGAIEIKPNIKFKEVMKKVVTSGLITDDSCDFTSAGSVTLTERIIQPIEFQVNLELCKTPFESITIDVLVAWWLYSVVLRVIFTHEPLASVAYLRTSLVSSK